MTAIRRPHRALAASAIAALALAPALLVTTPAAAATFPVHDEASFVAAIDAANLDPDPDPDIIEITADISLTAVAPTIDEPLTVRGGNHTIHGNGFRAFYAAGTTFTVEDLTISGASRGIFVTSAGTDSTTTVTRVTITGATSHGMEIENSDLTITDSTVTGTGGYRNLQYSTFFDPRTIVITGSHFDGGLADQGGWFLLSGPANLEMTDVTFDRNNTDGMWLNMNNGATATLRNVTATENKQYGLNFFVVTGASIDLDDTEGDVNGWSGGRIYTSGGSAIVRGSDPNNNAGAGWSVEARGTADVTFETALATENDAGFLLNVKDGSSVTIRDSLVQAGQIGVDVDADNVDAGGTVTLERTDIAGSSAHGLRIAESPGVDVRFVEGEIELINSSADGAGVNADLQDSTLTLERSLISQTKSIVTGGGVFVRGDADSAFHVLSSTFSNTSSDGGGALVAELGTATIAHSTIVGSGPGALVSLQADAAVTHSILEGGAMSLDTFLPTLTVDYSILESAGPDVGPALIAGAGNRVGLTAALLPLDHNGGPTRTRVPEPGSPAIDAGSPTFAAPPSTDQRGLARVQGGRIDVGAVEVVATLPATGRDAGAGWVWAALATLVAGGALLVGGRGYQRSLR